ncbi:MAG: RnfABCDGE type electron transport complex subunit B, partial [Bacillota bacterium]|nr:RnfABCDGE type electron transport complex subunit B [Bacillota bacterium]
MNTQAIIYAGSVLGGLGIVFGVGLAYAAKKFAVEVDPKVPLVREALPGANCGACGYPGCDAFSQAVVAGEAPVSGCTVGGNPTAKLVAEIMGVTAEEVARMVAKVKCMGSKDKCPDRYEYFGYSSCVAANQLSGGPKGCSYGCMGLGSCVQVCPFDAIHINASGLAEVDPEKCTACMKCIKICPKQVISLVPYDQKTIVRCNNIEIGAHVKKNCAVACIACRICEKNCPSDAIHVINNLA